MVVGSVAGRCGGALGWLWGCPCGVALGTGPSPGALSLQGGRGTGTGAAPPSAPGCGGLAVGQGGSGRCWLVGTWGAWLRAKGWCPLGRGRGALVPRCGALRRGWGSGTVMEGWQDRLRWGQAERRQQQALWETLGVHPQGWERGGFGGHPSPPRGRSQGEQRGGGPDCGEGRCDLAAARAHILSNPLFVPAKVLAALINGCVIS